jgi:glycosyltransferase involved in cell wall biosynthesis
MRVLIFHGYLLRGTGSNVYNASLVQALARLGHEVHLLCQDRHAAEYEWVDRLGTWADGELRVEDVGGERDDEVPGSVTAYIPDISGLLPVYVVDSYEGFDVKAFAELTEPELERYLTANVSAVRDVVAVAGRPDAALANHLVMGPVILARAGLGFAIKIHGSALEYTVKPHPERFLPYAREGLAAGAGVLVGSRHTAESLWTAIGERALPARTRLGPPGVNTDLFAPIPKADAVGCLREAAAAVRGVAGDRWGRDPAGAGEALEWFAEAGGPRVIFVGKLIVSKGVDLLLAAWPLVAAANPGARLLLVGFGEYRDALERLWGSLSAGDLADVAEIAEQGRALEGGPQCRLEMLASFLESPPAGYRDDALRAADSIRFCGRLEHDEVALAVPATDALVFPSTFPEAFGMVAAEAAAAGSLPVSAAHSGLAEVSRELAAALPPEVRELVSFELGPEAVAAIAQRLNEWLACPGEIRAATREALRGTVMRLWSWEGVAEGVIAASQGRLDDVAPVADPDRPRK